MYGYEDLYGYEVEKAAGGIFAGISTFFTIGAIVSIFMIIVMWRIFSKAGRPGWASIIPIYNILVMIDIAGLEWWYLLLLLIPIANIFAIFKIYIGIAENFGKSVGFGIAMVFFSIICMPILAFGSAEYEG